MERTEQMIEFYEDLYDLLNQENNRIYSVYTEILNALNSIFAKNGDILVNGKSNRIIKGIRRITGTWSVCPTFPT